MRTGIFLFSLSALAAAASASAIPQDQPRDQPHDRLVKRQTRVDTATIPTFSYSPSTTVYLGGGPAANATSSVQPPSGTTTRLPEQSQAPSNTPVASATGTETIPTYSFFPSSTVPVGPAGGNNGGNRGGSNNDGNSRGGNQPGNGTGAGSATGTGAGAQPTAGTGDDGQADEESKLRQQLSDLLSGLLDFLQG
ncbi:hypothetical protein F4802DRAFT_328005 [Xylaria palmicola]|nr:hypothetical protein F4802DRAFT_328005 [Xylaria palmicola]